MRTLPDFLKAEAAVLRRMGEGVFRFNDLWIAAEAEQGVEPRTFYRLADKLIQRERKAGRIEQQGRRGDWQAVSSAKTEAF